MRGARPYFGKDDWIKGGCRIVPEEMDGQECTSNDTLEHHVRLNQTVCAKLVPTGITRLRSKCRRKKKCKTQNGRGK